MNEPLLDLRVYKYPMFTCVCNCNCQRSSHVFGYDFNTSLCTKCPRYFTAELWADDASRCGNNGVMSPITGKLFDKYGPRILGIVGLSITAVSTYMLANLQIDSSHTLLFLFAHATDVWDGDGDDATYDKMDCNQLPTRLNPHGTAVNKYSTNKCPVRLVLCFILVAIMNSVNIKQKLKV